MTRKEGWELALYNLTMEAVDKPHVWGEHDCVTFGADCVFAMTGEDPIAVERGTYESPAQAAKVIKLAGAKDLGDLVAQRLPEIDVNQARRGDAVLCDGPDGEFIAICQGHTAVGPAQHGLIHVPMTQALRAYRVA